MTVDATAASLAAIADALVHMQGQLDRVERNYHRTELVQREILRWLNEVDARSDKDRASTKARLSMIAELAARTHAAALGNGAPLPADVADDPLLENYRLTQPADRSSMVRALVDWRREASRAGSAELSDLLVSQYRPSPTDTAETRILRYQLAAITRAELEGRGVEPPPPAWSTRVVDPSAEDRWLRSTELADLWRAGESTALFAEPELAGALDLFESAERRGRGAPDVQLSADLAELHRRFGDRLAAGDRPLASSERVGHYVGLDAETEPQRSYD